MTKNQIEGCRSLSNKNDVLFCDVCSVQDMQGECARFRRECKREQIGGV